MSNIVLRNLTNDSLITDCTAEADKVFGGFDLGKILGGGGGVSPFPTINIGFTTVTSNTTGTKGANNIAVGGSAIFLQEIDQSIKGSTPNP